MLETDCSIPTEPVQIAQVPYKLYGTALTVKKELEAGNHRAGIMKKLRIGEDVYDDAIFEIRKSGANPITPSKPGKLSDADKIAICMRVMSGEKKTKIANDYGVTVATVIYTVKKNSGRPEIMEKKEQIEQRILADAAAGKSVTDIAVETGWTYQTVLQTIKDHEAEKQALADHAETEPENVPDIPADDDAEWLEPMPVPAAVFDAVSEKMVEIERKIEMNAAHIKAIEGQNEILREKLAELQTWVEAVR